MPDLEAIANVKVKDHETTNQHPLVSGMVDRIYWLDHRIPEDKSDPKSAMSKSCSNIFEVDMVVGLVQYLISGNAYDLGDIAVLVSNTGSACTVRARLIIEDPLQWATGSSYPSLAVDLCRLAERKRP